MALLIADATPVFRAGTEVIRAVVRGATMMDSPIPNTSEPGQQIGEVVGRRQDRRRPAAAEHPALAVGWDPREPQQAERHDRRAEAHEEPWAEPCRELPDSRGEQHQEQEARDQCDAGGLFVVAEGADHEDPEEGERHVQRAVDHERRDVGHGEVPGSEQAWRHQRVAAPGHQQREARSPRPRRPPGSPWRSARSSRAAGRGSSRRRVRPTATATTSEPSQSKRPVACSSRDSGTNPTVAGRRSAGREG